MKSNMQTGDICINNDVIICDNNNSFLCDSKESEREVKESRKTSILMTIKTY